MQDFFNTKKSIYFKTIPIFQNKESAGEKSQWTLLTNYNMVADLGYDYIENRSKNSFKMGCEEDHLLLPLKVMFIILKQLVWHNSLDFVNIR